MFSTVELSFETFLSVLFVTVFKTFNIEHARLFSSRFFYLQNCAIVGIKDMCLYFLLLCKCTEFDNESVSDIIVRLFVGFRHVFRVVARA